MMTTLQFDYVEHVSNLHVKEATMFDFNLAIANFKNQNPETKLSNEQMLYQFAPMGLITLEIV